MTGPAVGDVVDLEVGAVAHGGFCVSRSLGRVCFVRHALPGELVRARITQDKGTFVHADAVEVLRASRDRVDAPCPYAGPGRCGGCDWQHASGDAQRRLKSDVVREQFARLARLDLPDGFAVEPLPGGLLGWRTRVAYAVGPGGRLGLHRFHSHQVEPVARCLIAAPGVDVPPEGDWGALKAVEVVRDDEGGTALVGHRPGRSGRQSRGRRPPDDLEVLDGPPHVSFTVRGRTFRVAAGGFWQVHPAALATFTQALLDGLEPRAGDYVLDLYAGAGALTAFLAEAVGPGGRAVGVESSRSAVADAAHNLTDLSWAAVLADRVTPDVVSAAGRPDLVVLDPPRSGAGRGVMESILALAPRAVGYVACDPAALARDVRTALEAGWELRSVRGFDAFPMTHHVECVAILQPGSAGARYDFGHGVRA